MLELGGLWKHQNNPASTKSVRVFMMLKSDTIQKKKKKKKQSSWVSDVKDSVDQVRVLWIMETPK